MGYCSLNKGLLPFKQWVIAVKQRVITVETMGYYSLNNGLLQFEQWSFIIYR